MPEDMVGAATILAVSPRHGLSFLLARLSSFSINRDVNWLED